MNLPIARAFLALALAATTRHGGEKSLLQQIDFPELGHEFQADHCPGGGEGTSCTLDELLTARYARFPLGAFEVAYPADFLGDSKRVADLTEVLLGLVDVQKSWLGWLDPEGQRVASSVADLDTLRAWIQGWKKSALSSLEKAKDRHALQALDADETVVAAAGRLAKAMIDPAVLGFAMRIPRVQEIVLSPTRRDFMELLGFAGLADPEVRTNNWVEGVHEWTQFWFGTALVVALEYAPWTGFDPQFRTGLDMHHFGKTGLVEHVTQQGALALLWNTYEHPDPRFVDKGLAMNLVIEVCGQINTLEGSQGGISNSGAQTAPYERFVPGGNPNGGTLPPVPAAPFDSLVDNPWRKDHGATHFVEPLREGQKEGLKEAKKEHEDTAKDKLANFCLHDSNRGKYTIHAPFLGHFASAKQYPPTEFMNDYREFFRAYEASFLAWLQTRGDPASADASEAKYVELLQGLTSEGPEKGFEEVVGEVYGMPLSAESGATESLEWRFLAWVQAGK